jgi:glycosyltransferase involved in cell wall biosynthesis
MRRRRAHVIPNPVRDMRRFRGAPARSANTLIVSTGRLVPAKGYDLLLEALATLPQQLSGWKLVILGEGPERARLAALTEQLKLGERVSRPGWVAEPGETLMEAAMFVLPSRYEGFPNALLDAMACGLPVIASACTGPAAIITDGIDGLLVEVDSVAALAAALRRLMEDEPLRKKLGSAAAEVATRYRLSSIIEQWDAVLCPAHLASGCALEPPPASTP